MNLNRTKPRRRLYILQKGICHYCKELIPFELWTVDHVWPKSKGGTREPENIVGACLKCNREKADSVKGPDPILVVGDDVRRL